MISYMEITKSVEEDRRRPGNLIQSLAESSFDAWVKFWKGTPQSYDSETDYYKKGADVSMMLDLAIRQSSGNKHSLDDVYKKMFEMFPLGKGYTNKDFRKICKKYAGEKMHDFFSDYVYGTKPIEWEKYLSYAGLELKADKDSSVPVIGIVLNNSAGNALISQILPGSSADKAGLKAGDEIIAIDGIKADYSVVEKKLKEMKEGEKVKLAVFKNNELKNFNIKLEDSKVPKYRLEKSANPTPLQKSVYEGWLGVKWENGTK